MPLCLDRFGNPSAPAIPMVICDAYGKDEEDKELNFLMCGFGVGLSWGVCSAKVNVKDILPKSKLTRCSRKVLLIALRIFLKSNLKIKRHELY